MTRPSDLPLRECFLSRIVDLDRAPRLEEHAERDRYLALAARQPSLAFHVVDAPEASLAVRFREGGAMEVEPSRETGALAIHTRRRSLEQFLAGDRSVRLLFAAREWFFRGGQELTMVEAAELCAGVAALLLRLAWRLEAASDEDRRRSKNVNLDDGIVPIEHRIGADAFRERYGEPRRPVLLRRSCQTSSLEELRARYQGVTLWFNAGSEQLPALLDLSRYLQRVQEGAPVGSKVCMPVFPGVLVYMCGGDLLPLRDLFGASQALIVAPAGIQATVWHADWADNFLSLLFGQKVVELVPPWNEECMYVHRRILGEHDNVPYDLSAVHPARPDLDRHPAFRDATLLRVDMEPGDTLFIPRGWFHNVHNPTASGAVNAWSAP